MSVLFCSHLLRDIEQVCDEAVILKDGAIVHHAISKPNGGRTARSSNSRSPATMAFAWGVAGDRR